MEKPPHIEDPKPTPVTTHLETALESVDNEQAKFHLREAYQKYIVVSEYQLAESERHLR